MSHLEDFLDDLIESKQIILISKSFIEKTNIDVSQIFAVHYLSDDIETYIQENILVDNNGEISFEKWFNCFQDAFPSIDFNKDFCFLTDFQVKEMMGIECYFSNKHNKEKVEKIDLFYKQKNRFLKILCCYLLEKKEIVVVEGNKTKIISDFFNPTLTVDDFSKKYRELYGELKERYISLEIDCVNDDYD